MVENKGLNLVSEEALGEIVGGLKVNKKVISVLKYAGIAAGVIAGATALSTGSAVAGWELHKYRRDIKSGIDYACGEIGGIYFGHIKPKFSKK